MSGSETITVDELADRIRLPRAVTAELLVELEADGYAERHGSGWRLGPAASAVAAALLAGLPLDELDVRDRRQTLAQARRRERLSRAREEA